MEFVGDDTALLKKFAKQASGIVSKIKGVQQVALRFREGKDELRLDFDHEKASIAGISANEFGSTLKTSIQGSIPTKYIDDGKEVDIKVRFREEDRSQLSQIFEYLIPGKENSVYMASLVSQSEGESESKIYRKNKRKVVSITAKLGDLDLGTAVKVIRGELNQIQFPANYYYDFGGNFKKLKKNQIEMLLLVSLAFFLIYCILAALFESFSYPFIIIISIPFAIAGVIIALFLFNLSLNVSVYIGLVMLIGIVVNNAILLIEQFLRGINEKGSIRNRNELIEIIMHASIDRLRPILITTLTTVLGLLPTAFDMGEGSQLWRPLAITVVSGLTISTFLTLILVPLIFYRFFSWRNDLVH
ncbi:efflux RND transporter permease subunit [Leptospira sp. 'Mane']|uniref:efflux RND transporter permease subunit n=1 Tax=Leptospira sp. 'Mane' TaxID=3387407 RepID=UPI00398ADD7A